MLFFAAFSASFLAIGGASAVVTIASTELPSGSVRLEVTVARTLASEALIRILDPAEAATCDPNARVVRQLDLRDVTTAARSGARLMAGVWSVVDDLQNNTRTYTTSVSTARLRQQFVGLRAPQPSFMQGAVTGGSIAALAYACTYAVGAGDAVTVLAESAPATRFVAKSSPASVPADVSVYAHLPPAPNANGDGLILHLLTRTQYVSGCVGTRVVLAPVGYLQHEGTTIAGRAVALYSEAPVHHTGKNSHKRRGAKDVAAVDEHCSSIITLGEGVCPICVQSIAVTIPLADAGTVLDVVSRFMLIQEGVPVDESQRYLAHFLVPTEGGVVFLPAPAARRAEQPPPSPPHPVGGGPLARAVVKSGGLITSANRGAEREIAPGARSTAEVISAKLYDGKTSCVTVGLSGDVPKDAGARVFIDDAVLAKKTGETKSMAHDGAIDVDAARYVAGKLTTSANGDSELCFVPPTGSNEYSLKIHWSVRSSLKKEEKKASPPAEVKRQSPAAVTRRDEGQDRRVAPDLVPVPAAAKTGVETKDTLLDLAELCAALGTNCSGIIIIETVVSCGAGTEYDAVLGACVSATTTSLRQWIFVPIIFTAVIAIVGVILCIAAVNPKKTD